MIIKIPKWIAPLLLIGVTAGVAGTVMAESASATGQDKVGVCHRTASESNPYTYIFVPKDEAEGHITGTSKQHNEKVVWKEDGTWRGTPHKAGDLKLDYYANSSNDCSEYPPTSTTSTTSSTTSSSTSSSSSSTTTSPPETTTNTTSPPVTTTTTSFTTSTSSTTTSPPTTTTQPPTTTRTSHIRNTLTVTPRHRVDSPSTSPTGGIPGELARTGVVVSKTTTIAMILVLLGAVSLGGYIALRPRKH